MQFEGALPSILNTLEVQGFGVRLMLVVARRSGGNMVRTTAMDYLEDAVDIPEETMVAREAGSGVPGFSILKEEGVG